MDNIYVFFCRAVVLAVQLYRNACTLCPQIARHAILGNTLVVLFDALFQSLQVSFNYSFI